LDGSGVNINGFQTFWVDGNLFCQKKIGGTLAILGQKTIKIMSIFDSTLAQACGTLVYYGTLVKNY